MLVSAVPTSGYDFLTAHIQSAGGRNRRQPEMGFAATGENMANLIASYEWRFGLAELLVVTSRV
jgi:hypothetical protein